MNNRLKFQPIPNHDTLKPKSASCTPRTRRMKIVQNLQKIQKIINMDQNSEQASRLDPTSNLVQPPLSYRQRTPSSRGGLYLPHHQQPTPAVLAKKRNNVENSEELRIKSISPNRKNFYLPGQNKTPPP